MKIRKIHPRTHKFSSMAMSGLSVVAMKAVDYWPDLQDFVPKGWYFGIFVVLFLISCFAGSGDE